MKIKLSSILGLLCSAAFGLLFVSCSSKKTPELHVYNWAEYIDEGVVEAFEAEYGCKVIMDFFDSNETMYAKVKAGAGGYDVIFPSSYQAAIMYEEGLIRKLDLSLIPNAADVDKDYLQTAALDSELVYSIPYMLGTTGIGYSSEVLGEIKPSWTSLMLPDVKNRSTLLNDMRETLGAALTFLGYSINTTNEAEIAAAAEVVKKWKTNIAKFENEQYQPGIASGEFLLVHGYSGNISQVIGENEAAGIKYMLPEEGFVAWCDDMVIPFDAPSPELAHSFLNFMISGNSAAKNMEYCYVKAPVVSAYELISEELKQDETVFVDSELMEKAEIIKPLGDAIQLYTKYWDQVKASE